MVEIGFWITRMIFGFGKNIIKTQNTVATENGETNTKDPCEYCNMHPEHQQIHVNPALQPPVRPDTMYRNLRETMENLPESAKMSSAPE